MTDLDRKIAELKGWEWDEVERMVWTEPAPPPLPAAVNPIPNGGRLGYIMSFCCWSRDDSKALELVDEMKDAQFYMHGSTPNPRRWWVMFQFHDMKYVTPYGVKEFKFEGDGPTRPEAICRAYIAAVTWMRERKA